MGTPYPYELLEDPQELAEMMEWSREVYLDFNACRDGQMDEAQFRAKYITRCAILCLDMTGFTESAIRFGELYSLLRIHDVQRVCAPIFKEFRSRLIRAFADDMTAIFDDPNLALDAALEVHRRIHIFNRSQQGTEHPAECKIGIGYGNVFSIGPNLAMGDEMNRASKLGEDTARANETLITQNVFDAVKLRGDCVFEPQSNDDLPFPFYLVRPENPD